MYNTEDIKNALSGIIHPEIDEDIVSAGIVSDIRVSGQTIAVTISLRKKRDPFAASIRRQISETLGKKYPGMQVDILEEETYRPPQKPMPLGERGVGKIIAIASGKGGVGKSTFTANLALTLRNMGYSVGILDADIYGPSQPKMFGVEDYRPLGTEIDGHMLIEPAESMGIKIASIGFFISGSDALAWRGPMAATALRQLIHETEWGKLDYLLIDLPPGTGDIHLSVATEMKIDGAVIVSTPQQVAVADVVRGISFFRAEGVGIPILGIVENMAWFTPVELPENRYYIFGRGGAKQMAEKEKVDFLGDIPIIQSVMEGADEGRPGIALNSEAEKYFREIADKIVEKAH